MTVHGRYTHGGVPGVSTVHPLAGRVGYPGGIQQAGYSTRRAVSQAQQELFAQSRLSGTGGSSLRRVVSSLLRHGRELFAQSSVSPLLSRAGRSSLRRAVSLLSRAGRSSLRRAVSSLLPGRRELFAQSIVSFSPGQGGSSLRRAVSPLSRARRELSAQSSVSSL